MNVYEHSVTLDKSKCTGCTTCLRHCPTEAIRVRDGHAQINPERCIDCGECVRVCPHKAKKVRYSKLENFHDKRFKIAIVPPSMFGQFERLEDVDIVLQGLKDLGFDEVYEVAKSAELVSAYTRLYLKTEGIKKPVISSACPAIVRLITLRFPYLKDNILPMLPPMEVAAHDARIRAKEKNPDLKDEDICVYFISPCPAKVSYIKNGFGNYKSEIDVVLSMSDIYFSLIGVMNDMPSSDTSSEAGMIGIGWATSGGESSAIFNDNYLAADGIRNAIKILDQLENGNIPPQLEFVELNACIGGCVGGALTIENPFIAKTRLISLKRYMPVSLNKIPDGQTFIPEDYLIEQMPDYVPISRLSDNFAKSMKMLAQIKQIREELPGIDCGACGSPTCRAFAEDLVKGTISDKAECVLYKHIREKEEENDG
ncbi:MAG: 4Fe-4S binding protein [Clostridia bacterium]|nr:4Fe-4S binding protein [Clostridia bacterium]